MLSFINSDCPNCNAHSSAFFDFSSFLLKINSFKFDNSFLKYWALLRAFLSRLMMRFRSEELKFFETSNSECTILYFSIKLSTTLLDSAVDQLYILENFKNSSTSSSFERESRLTTYFIRGSHSSIFIFQASNSLPRICALFKILTTYPLSVF